MGAYPDTGLVGRQCSVDVASGACNTMILTADKDIVEPVELMMVGNS